MPRPALSIAIVGAPYPNKRGGVTRRFEVELCKPGDPVELVPEPKNEHDEHAIAVYSERGVQMGYLPSERAVLIGSMMRHGHEVRAIFQEQTSWGAAIRVAFDGEVPTLPARRDEQIDSEPDFYPDEEWPD